MKTARSEREAGRGSYQPPVGIQESDDIPTEAPVDESTTMCASFVEVEPGTRDALCGLSEQLGRIEAIALPTDDEGGAEISPSRSPRSKNSSASIVAIMV